MPRLRIAIARVLRDENEPVTMFSAVDFRNTVIGALDPATSVERYGRRWRISRPTQDGEWVSGRLGFVEPTVTEGLSYSEEQEDFVESQEEYGGGAYSNFSLNTENQFILFQLVPRFIQPQSFVGALKALFRQSPFPITAESVFDPDKFDQWLESVDTVSRLSVSFRRPNPSYPERTDILERMLEPNNATSGKLELVASEEDSGLDVGTDDIQGLVEHADKGYGRYTANGRSGDANRLFVSDRNVPKKDIVVDDENDWMAVLARIRREGQELIDRIVGRDA